jgi:two-component system cell cycle response regulator CtrA
MRVLLVEGDSCVAQSIELMLKSEGFNVYTTDSGEEGVELAKLYEYDIALLGDVRDMTCVDMMRSIRDAKVKTSSMIVSGFRTIENIVHAFGVGADDYMTKPFHKNELVARIHAIVRRTKGHAVSRIEIGPLLVDLDTRTAKVNGQDVAFTGKEFHLLELFALRVGAVQSKEQILNHLYGGRDEPELKIIDVFVCKLRKKLAAAGAKDLLETVWGRGYLIRRPAPEMVGAA